MGGVDFKGLHMLQGCRQMKYGNLLEGSGIILLVL